MHNEQPTPKRHAKTLGIATWDYLRLLLAKLEHWEIKGEFDSLKLLDDEAFENAKTRHFSRREPPIESDNLGVTLLLAVIGAPSSFLGGLFTGDVAYYFGAAAWSIAMFALYAYLAHTAKYWREHNAIRGEEVRRYGHASFG